MRVSQHPTPTPANHGFTLVEVLVALAILAIALSAAVRAASVAVDSANETKLRTLATWIAQDKIAMASALVKINGRLPAVGETSDVQNSAGFDFSIQSKISDTPNSAFRKLDVKILRPGLSHTDTDGQSLISMTSYLVLPPDPTNSTNAAKAVP